jgi:hypothetical protein
MPVMSKKKMILIFQIFQFREEKLMFFSANIFVEFKNSLEYVVRDILNISFGGWLIIVSILCLVVYYLFKLIRFLLKEYHKHYEKSVMVRDGVIAGLEKNEERLKIDKQQLQEDYASLKTQLSLLSIAASKEAGPAFVLLSELCQKLIKLILFKILVNHVFDSLYSYVLLRPPLCPLTGKKGEIAKEVLNIKFQLGRLEARTMMLVVEASGFLNNFNAQPTSTPNLPDKIKNFSIAQELQTLKDTYYKIGELWGDEKNKFFDYDDDPISFDEMIKAFEEVDKGDKRAELLIKNSVN